MQLLEFMDDYFKQSANPSLQNEVEAESGFSDWEKINSPERLIKDYSFSRRSTALEFLRQLLLFEDQFNHHAKITIEYNNIRIEVNTHGIDEVTQIDIDYARTVDEIFLDVSEYE